MIYIDDDGRSERVAAITDDLGRVMSAVPPHLRRSSSRQSGAGRGSAGA
jgi:integrase/recombinase XerC